MADGKRYYWLKLQDGFFGSKRIKKLRKLAGGDTFTIIYLKMQLLAMKHDGILVYTGLEDNFAEELALDLDEEPDNVKVTINFLLSCGLMETFDNKEYFIPYAVENVGSEGASAKRVREFRGRQEDKALQSNADVTLMKHLCNGEKEIEKEIEKEKRESTPAHFTHIGSYGWVKLTDAEYAQLVEAFGEAETRRCIDYVDSSAQGNNNRNGWSDWSVIVRRCAEQQWGIMRDKAPGGTAHPTVDTEALKAMLESV